MESPHIVPHVDGRPAGDMNVTLARVAHELRTPVSLISGSLENLEESLHMLVQYVERTNEFLGCNDEVSRLRKDLRLDYRIENAPGLLRICSEGAQRLSHVVNQLRFYSRPPEIRDDVCTDVGEVLRCAVAMALPGHSVAARVDWALAADLGAAVGPADFLGQVFLNLVRNALDALATTESPRIVIAARTVGGGDAPRRVEIDVSDNGPGIEPAHRERVFDEFFSTKTAADGLGLGLSISRDIIAAVGGRLELHRTGSEGTQFRVTLRAA